MIWQNMNNILKSLIPISIEVEALMEKMSNEEKLYKGNGERSFNIEFKKIFQQEMLKLVTHQSNMSRCINCDSENIINNLAQSDREMVKTYIVKHICLDCKKGYRVCVEIDELRRLELLNNFNNIPLFVIEHDVKSIYLNMIILKILLEEARKQIELHVRHGRETVEVQEY